MLGKRRRPGDLRVKAEFRNRKVPVPCTAGGENISCVVCGEKFIFVSKTDLQRFPEQWKYKEEF